MCMHCNYIYKYDLICTVHNHNYSMIHQDTRAGAAGTGAGGATGGAGCGSGTW